MSRIMDVSLAHPSESSVSGSKRKNVHSCHQDSAPKPKRKKGGKAISEYIYGSAEKRNIYEQNSMSSPLLRLPAEIRNLIYDYLLSDNVIHISVRECPEDDRGAWSYAQYRQQHTTCRTRTTSDRRFLRITHALCNQPYDLEDHVHTNPNSPSIPTNENGKSCYRLRHKPCYSALATQKANWIRNGDDVTINPLTFQDLTHPGYPIHFLRTSRQIYSETRDLPYATNTFAFHEGDTMELFLSRVLSPRQKVLVRGLQADGWMGQYYEPGVRVQRKTLQALTGLERFGVAVTDLEEGLQVVRLENAARGIGRERCKVVVRAERPGSVWERLSCVTTYEEGLDGLGSSGGECSGEGCGYHAKGNGIVKVVVDRLGYASNGEENLEGLIKANVEAALSRSSASEWD